jgi:hypothetical protein
MDVNLLFFIISLAFIWFDTRAIPEYLSLLRFKFHKFEDWKVARKGGMDLDYHFYLQVFFDSFIVRLITCPYCVLSWLNLFTLPFIGFEKFSIHLPFSWVGYFALKKVLKFLNE